MLASRPPKKTTLQRRKRWTKRCGTGNDAIEKILERLQEKKGGKLDEEEQELFRQQVVSCAEFKAKEYPDLNRPGSGMELVPCRPHLGECPPLETRREMPWAEVYVKAVDIDKDGTITPYNAPCVLKSAILSPMDAIQAKQMDELADTLMQVHKALIKKRRDFVDAIKECRTLRTEELCGAPRRTKARPSAALRRKTLATLTLFCASRPWPT